ncbi:GNAT family N-acetyltransferase [Paenibacillus chitinolyticus]|uniref:GNAT family N-acetyltransferase n=1 Tax=Paenibacillus chitinolyticus TaxID=79263 RepID=UPI00365A150C
MTHGVTIHELESMEAGVLNDLTELLIRVVEDGASIGFLPPVSWEDANTYWKKVIEPGVLAWNAVCDGKIVGTVQLHLAMKRNATHRAEVVKLMVHPEYRRKGVAHMLMQALEKTAAEEGRSLLVLDTREGDASNKLYKSFGYVEAGRIPHFAKSSDGSLHTTIFYYKLI